ncbi:MULTISPECIES: restriction endonuclease subunit S [Bacilli]|uniref:restriction endonuclease subunit S n=1 Tax=Bacilli TaxID=91061 RepID=UPI001D4428BB|nr:MULTISPECIES: restriction endonuclease subunit S [Bacilli]HJG66291.1 restriction endonuclease subunit S [Staphylococcus ureilyticus]
MKVKLRDFVELVKTRVDIKDADVANYISTDNMLPNRGGVEFGNSKLPTTKTVNNFIKGDVLISNIRPYFKKIWFADRSGTRSSDVLCFRATNEKLSKEYLYCVLQSDSFFNYVMSTSKGTKMPRGDKEAILDYEFELVSKEKQYDKYHSILLLERKIYLNNRINDNLLELSRNIFKKFFPNVNEGIDTIGNYIKNYDKYRKPLSKKQRNQMPGMYRYIGATSVNDYINKYNFNGIYLLLGEDGTVQDDKGYPILQYIHGKFWPNNHAHVLQGKVVSTEWLYLFFLQKNIQEIVTGAVQKKISQKNLNSLKVNIPNENELKNFDDFIQPIFKKIRILEDENIALEKLKQQFLNQFF